MVVAWALFPLVLLAVCTGCGLAVERVAGWELPGAILPSVGLALVIVAGTLSTDSATTAPLSTALVVVLALAGYATSVARVRRLRPDPWGLGVGFGVFAVCAAPMVLSGNATFLGYFTLNDSAFHFALIDQLLAHGHDVSGPLSSFTGVVHGYLQTSYPIGADVALGAVRPLVGQDVAWIFQPYLAVILALGGVALDELLRGVVASRPLRAACAFVAAQAGLVYAFYLEASIKELASTWLITLCVVLVFATLRATVRVRGILPLVVVTVAGLDVLQLAIAPWLAPPLAVFVVVAGWRARPYVQRASRRRVASIGAVSALVIAALAVPIISRASTFLNIATNVLTQKGDLGNLFTPLSHWQILGIWPSGDFRYPVVTHWRIAHVLLWLALASAILGAVWLVRRRAWPPLLLLVGNGIAAAYLLTRASPYATAKVMMLFSVTAVLTAMLGAAALDGGTRRRVAAWLLAALIGGGVLWTNALGYHYAAIAPRGPFTELSSIDSRFSGRGPTFYNLSDEYGGHFLRHVTPFDAGLTTPTPRVGAPPRPGIAARLPWDPDDLAFDYLESFRLLVLGRSPRISRPPANYRLVYQGRYYDVWERTATPQVLEHVPLGTKLEPSSVPSCQVVRAAAARASREHARLAYAALAPNPAFVPTTGGFPPKWSVALGDPDSLVPRQQAGAVFGFVNVNQPGRYAVWLQASFIQSFEVWVGPGRVGSVSNALGPAGQFVRVGFVTLGRGRQPVTIVRPGNNLMPGDAGTGWLLGPLILVPQGAQERVGELAPQDARSLCGQSLDWLEIVR